MIHSFDFPLSFAYLANIIFGAGKGVNGFVSKLEELSKSGVILTDSGLDAIRLYLRAIHLRPGDEIIVPAYICYYLIEGLISDGYSICFVDIDENYKFSISDLERKISYKTKAVIVPHMFGIQSDIAAVKLIAANYGASVLEDCAQSINSIISGYNTEIKGDAAVLSFGLTKPITAIGGGALVTENADILKSARLLCKQRTSLKTELVKLIKFILYSQRDLFYLIAEKNYHKHCKQIINCKSDISNSMNKLTSNEIFRRFNYVQGVIGFASLSEINSYNNKRMLNSAYLIKSLSSLPVIIPDNINSVDLIRLPVRFKGANREKTFKITQFFRKNNVFLEMPYPCIQEMLSLHIDCLCAKQMADTTIALPIHPSLTRIQLDRIIDICKYITSNELE